MNQGEELNRNGEAYIHKHPELKVKVVDGSRLTAAVVINTIPKASINVVIIGHLTKVAYTIAYTLCQRRVQVTTLHLDKYEKLKSCLPQDCREFLIHSTSDTFSSNKIWLMGEGSSEEDQEIKGLQKGLCLYHSHNSLSSNDAVIVYTTRSTVHTSPTLLVPKSLVNIHSYENWLPKKAMNATRVASILHALEGWEMHECGTSLLLLDFDQVWEACLHHGFQPLMLQQN